MAKFPLISESRVITVEIRLIAKRVIPLIMVLDTGASITTIPIEVAIALGRDPVKSTKRIEMITASGKEYTSIVTIPEIELLGFSLKNIEVVCHNLPPNSLASGLLGLNVLREFDIFLGFRSTKTLEVSR